MATVNDENIILCGDDETALKLSDLSENDRNAVARFQHLLSLPEAERKLETLRQWAREGDVEVQEILTSRGQSW